MAFHPTDLPCKGNEQEAWQKDINGRDGTGSLGAPENALPPQITDVTRVFP